MRVLLPRRMYMFTVYTAVRLLISIAGFASASQAGLVNYTLVDQSSGRTLLPGKLYVPPEAANGPRPLILFLHGAGEIGTDNQAQVNSNINNLLAEAERRGAFLYAPQTNSNWSDKAVTDRVLSMVNKSLTDYAVASNQLYVTGLSMGGGGAWNMLNRYGDTFAAGVVIAGIAPGSDFKAANMLDESVWAFHARNDTVVSVGASRNAMTFILRAASETRPPFPASNDNDFEFHASTIDFNYTEYKVGGHGIWHRVYDTPEVYDWMFSRVAVPEPSSLMLSAAAFAGLIAFRYRARISRCSVVTPV